MGPFKFKFRTVLMFRFMSLVAYDRGYIYWNHYCLWHKFSQKTTIMIFHSSLKLAFQKMDCKSSAKVFEEQSYFRYQVVFNQTIRNVKNNKIYNPFKYYIFFSRFQLRMVLLGNSFCIFNYQIIWFNSEDKRIFRI